MIFVLELFLLPIVLLFKFLFLYFARVVLILNISKYVHCYIIFYGKIFSCKTNNFQLRITKTVVFSNINIYILIIIINDRRGVTAYYTV